MIPSDIHYNTHAGTFTPGFYRKAVFSKDLALVLVHELLVLAPMGNISNSLHIQIHVNGAVLPTLSGTMCVYHQSNIKFPFPCFALLNLPYIFAIL